MVHINGAPVMLVDENLQWKTLGPMFWGDRYGQVHDPFGHNWSVGQHVRDVAPEDLEKAMKKQMFRKAATIGDNVHKLFLADELFESETDPESLREAICWYRAVAENSPRAQFRLGVLAENQVLGPPDLGDAARRYCVSAKEGYSEARRMLEREDIHRRLADGQCK